MKRCFALVAAAFAVAFSAPSHASAPKGDQAAAAASYIQSLGEQALAVIQNSSLDAAAKQAQLADLFGKNVEFDWVGKFVMGRQWREATDDQKARYLTNYQKFLTKHYTSRFTEYTSGTFKVTGGKEVEPGEYLVSMHIQSNDKSQPPVEVDYKLHSTKSGFKVFDIIVEGVSMITTQRSEFGSILNQKGIEGLIEQLAVK